MPAPRRRLAPVSRLLSLAASSLALVVLVVLPALGAEGAAGAGEEAEEKAAEKADARWPGGEALKGKFGYDEFEKPTSCRQCHVQFYYQWSQSMMAQAYTHEWDEIEYFVLAVGHGERNPKFKPVADGCNGCHTPLAFMAGELPPPRPEENSRANEAVSCEVCHNIPGWDDDALYNFSYQMDPGETKYGNRGGAASPAHKLEKLDGMQRAEMCANCHNEKSPWGVWVKSTYNEWKAGPYAAEGVPCQDCHMPAAPSKRAVMGKDLPDARQHLFHGAHVPAKIRGAIEVLANPDREFAEVGDPITISVQLFNQKAGHKIPTGSVEDRLLHLHVEAIDSAGNTFHLPVDRKGFDGEEYTIASKDAKAYQDLAEMMDVPEGFDGLPRDGVPAGDRIFRMPYFTEKGVMTMAQWNTAKLGVDYRIGPRETKIETYTWNVPGGVAPGPVTVRAVLYYQLLVKPVADFLKVPAEESELREINRAETTFEVI